MFKFIFLATLLYNVPQQTTARAFDMRTCDWEYDEQPSPGTWYEPACPGYTGWGILGYTHIRINYLDYPPYIYADGNSGSPKGIWVDFLKDFTRRACGGRSSNIQWIRRAYTEASDLEDYCRSNAHQCAMSIPSVGSDGAISINRNEWASFWSIRGIALVTIPGEAWRRTLKGFSGGVINTWPIFILCLNCAFISGFVIWLLDTWFNEEEFPRPFFKGWYNGVWCAFITMTTVGYGDRVPKGMPARLFAIIWIIIGITILGILVSILSSSLTGSLETPGVIFAGNTIGCLETVASIKQYITKYGGTPKIAKDYIELESFMARGLIDGFAMDTRQLQYYYKTRLSKLEPKVRYKVERVYEYDRAFGMSVHAPSAATEKWRTDGAVSTQPWDDCLRKYMAMNLDRKFEMEAYYTRKMKDVMNGTILQPQGAAEVSIIDPKSNFFKDLVWTCFALGVVIMLLGLGFENLRTDFFRRGANTGKIGLSSNSGYTGNGEESNADETNEESEKRLSKEERNVQELIERTMQDALTRLQETDRNVRKDITEMSKVIRREMATINKTNQLKIEEQRK